MDKKYFVKVDRQGLHLQLKYITQPTQQIALDAAVEW